MADVIELGPHSKMSPAEALAYCAREEWEDVIIVGYNPDGDFMVRSSHMSREGSLWLAEHLKMHVLDLQSS